MSIAPRDMATEYYTTDQITRLDQVPIGGKIHVIGVSGVAMAQLAVLLSECGYTVSGSDKEFYEPMGSLLRQSAVSLCHGYDGTNIPVDASLVVIGNAVTRKNPEVEAAQARGLRYSIFPQLLYELCIKGRDSIVVAGTHGKSTTSSLAAFLLNRLGYEPSYFVGGVIRDLPKSLVQGKGKLSVVEGDEYDSAFFAKVPKFLFYKPNTLILTSIEFDHADIYKDLACVEAEFEKLLLAMPPGTWIVANADDHGVERVVRRRECDIAAQIRWYGTQSTAQVRLTACTAQGLSQVCSVRTEEGEVTFRLPLPGQYNALNSIAVLAALALHGIPTGVSAPLLENFKGVRRRQEVRLDSPIVLIEDFAHHPSAVRETLRGIRAAFPARKVWAVFEPRSNTSRKKLFQEDYLSAFSDADEILISAVTTRENDAANDLLNVYELAEGIHKRGKSAEALASVDAIAEKIIAAANSTDVVVVMSNGSFGGLIDRLEKSLSSSPVR